MIGFLCLIGLAVWCWLYEGPRFLRWPVIVLLVLMTSGHQLGESVAASADALAAILLPFLLLIVGLLVMLRGGRRRRTRSPYHYRERRYRHDRWW
ncbi:MAG: hypothetical protein AAF491_00450 [Verrucomicrobiota bacterium]